MSARPAGPHHGQRCDCGEHYYDDVHDYPFWACVANGGGLAPPGLSCCVLYEIRGGARVSADVQITGFRAGLFGTVAP